MRILLIAFIFFNIICIASASYNVYNPDEARKITSSENMQTMFILDYSNSMNERIMGESKFAILQRSFKNVLANFPQETPVGVRVYGQRWGFTNMDACRASTLVEGTNKYNRDVINQKLTKYHPRGMTPITYSLKETVDKDFNMYGINKAMKHIILVTDGGENCDESPCEYAMNLIKTRRDIKIDVIAINVDSEDDLDQLRCTANVTGGKLYSAHTEAELRQNLDNVVRAKKAVEAKIMY